MPADEEAVQTSEKLWSEVVEEADPDYYLEDDIGYIAYEFGGRIIKRSITNYTE